MSITPQEALQRTIEHREIFYDEMLSLMRQIMAGEISPVMTAAILTGLRVKKETIGEITAAATVMRELVHQGPWSRRRMNILWISSAPAATARTPSISPPPPCSWSPPPARASPNTAIAAFRPNPAAPTCWKRWACASICKPNRWPPAFATTGIGFMFAPNHHSAMKNVAPVRREMGVRTIFNILGPLTNPASAPNQLMGVFHPDLVGIQVRVMQRLGAQHVLVVWGKDGMDEISLGAATLVGELKNGEMWSTRFTRKISGWR
jgi:anthranilate phosphoribosyltransferase